MKKFIAELTAPSVRWSEEPSGVGCDRFGCGPQLLVAASPEGDYQEPLNHRGEHQVPQNQIAMAQYECFQRISKESNRKTKRAGEESNHQLLFTLPFPVLPRHLWLPVSAGLECNTTWDGWLCWDGTEAGVTAEQSCPDYFHDFDPHGKLVNAEPLN